MLEYKGTNTYKEYHIPSFQHIYDIPNHVVKDEITCYGHPRILKGIAPAKAFQFQSLNKTPYHNLELQLLQFMNEYRAISCRGLHDTKVVFVFAADLTESVFGGVFGIIAGVMVFLALDELLPAAKHYSKGHETVYGLVFGMILMAFSLMAFRI